MAWIWALGATLLLGLLWGEHQESTSHKLAFKTPLSVLFVLTAVLLPHLNQTYYGLILAGLILGLIGDVCLATTSDKIFRIGTISFLVGHIFYIIAFAGLTNPGDWVTPGLILILAAAFGIYRWVAPHAGDMKNLVIAYIVVISIMLLAARAASRATGLDPMGPWVIFIGSLAFFLSDICVARDRFIKNQFLNRFIGLPLYYAAQFMIASSVALTGSA